MVESFLRPLGILYQKRIGRLEKKIGYKLVFGNISDLWIKGWMIYDMTSVWKRYGINAIGVNYFTMGKLIDGISSRFNREADQYQAWFGGYVVQFSKGRDLTVQDHFNLGIADQKNWLRIFGDPEPLIELSESEFKEIGDIKLGNFFGKMYEGGGLSHSDVGPHNGKFGLKVLMAGMVTIFNLSNPNINLQTRDFIPKASQAYETVRLKGYVIILNVAENIKAVLYGNGAIFKHGNGEERNTFESTKDQLLQDLKSVAVLKV